MNALVSNILPAVPQPFDLATSSAASGPFCLSCVGEAMVSDAGLGCYFLQMTVLLGRFRAFSDVIACAERRSKQRDLCIDAMSDFTPNLLIIQDSEQRLCLAGQLSRNGIIWCDPVTSDAEARQVVLQASRLRGQAMRETDMENSVAARSLRFQAGALEARLVDPAWRVGVQADVMHAA